MPKLKEEKKKMIDKLVRDKVFEEAIKLLAKEDTDLFTMNELAEKAGIAKGTLYNYFSNKFDVVLYVYNRLNDEFMDKIKSYFAQHPKEYKNNLRYLYRASLEAIRTNRFTSVAKLQFHLNALNDPLVNRFEVPIYKTVMIKNRVFLTDFFENGKRDGVFKDLDPKVMAGFVDIYILGVQAYCFLREPGILNTEKAYKSFPQTEEMLISAVCRDQSAD